MSCCGKGGKTVSKVENFVPIQDRKSDLDLEYIINYPYLFYVTVPIAYAHVTNELEKLLRDFLWGGLVTPKSSIWSNGKCYAPL